MKKEGENTSAEHLCLKIFCAMSASVTHELKNTLSIINENAGLLEDLGSMAEEGVGVPVQYVDDATKTVMKQVTRSNLILKNLNTFSHSGDHIPAQADLKDIISLMVALTSRFAAMHKISVSMSCPENIKIRTNMLVFCSLLFTTLCKAYNACPEGSGLSIHAGGDEQQCTIITILLEGKPISESYQFPESDEQVLAAEIGMLCRRNEGTLIIDVSACCL